VLATDLRAGRAPEYVFDDRRTVAALARVDAQREARVRVSRQLGESRRRQLEHAPHGSSSNKNRAGAGLLEERMMGLEPASLCAFWRLGH